MIKVYYQGQELWPEDYHFDKDGHLVLNFNPQSRYDRVYICTMDEKEPLKVLHKKVVHAGIV